MHAWRGGNRGCRGTLDMNAALMCAAGSGNVLLNSWTFFLCRHNKGIGLILIIVFVFAINIIIIIISNLIFHSQSNPPNHHVYVN